VRSWTLLGVDDDAACNGQQCQQLCGMGLNLTA